MNKKNKCKFLNNEGHFQGVNLYSIFIVVLMGKWEGSFYFCVVFFIYELFCDFLMGFLNGKLGGDGDLPSFYCGC